MNNITNLEKTKVTRRKFLVLSFNAILGLITASLAVPIAGYLLPPAKKKDEKWIEVGAAAQFKVGEPALVEVTPPGQDGWTAPTKEGIYVINKGNFEFDVFSINCTHLGCPIQWNSQAQRFFCPCHGGVLAKDGKVLGGPPPRALDKMPTRVENGKLLVDYKRFLVGVAESIEL